MDDTGASKTIHTVPKWDGNKGEDVSALVGAF
jgi:hypothetical protein